MKALIGVKVGMTQISAEDGKVTPVTLVQVGPCTVTQVKTIETDGYEAVQLGYGEAKIGKSLAGHTKKAKISPKTVKEFRGVSTEQEVAVGDSFDVSAFEVGDKVAITGISKGKGFAGTVKRWNFQTSAKSHGGKGVIRKGGSIGSMYPQKVFKGKKMSGRMGYDQVTTKNLTIEMIDKENNLLGIRGAVPGPRKGNVFVKGIA